MLNGDVIFDIMKSIEEGSEGSDKAFFSVGVSAETLNPLYIHPILRGFRSGEHWSVKFHHHTEMPFGLSVVLANPWACL